jgi:HD-GYP domain-containing protein (c-di-GMP phosphodiesterase class II)
MAGSATLTEAPLSWPEAERWEGVSHAIDAQDPITAAHGNRVGSYALAIAEALSLPSETAETIRVGACLHDIGKIVIPKTILNKPGPLTSEEFRIVKLHPLIGRKMLEQGGAFDAFLSIVELHHEHLDGSGYPHGLTHQEIPLSVRIVQIADVYDALTSTRPYRGPLSHVDAVEILERGAGLQWDPDVIRVFLSLFTNHARSGVLANFS